MYGTQPSADYSSYPSLGANLANVPAYGGSQPPPGQPPSRYGSEPPAGQPLSRYGSEPPPADQPHSRHGTRSPQSHLSEASSRMSQMSIRSSRLYANIPTRSPTREGTNYPEEPLSQPLSSGSSGQGSSGQGTGRGRGEPPSYMQGTTSSLTRSGSLRQSTRNRRPTVPYGEQQAQQQGGRGGSRGARVRAAKPRRPVVVEMALALMEHGDSTTTSCRLATVPLALLSTPVALSPSTVPRTTEE